MAKPQWKPWHKVVTLRDDLKTGELALKQFASDLHEVLMQNGTLPLYENAQSFFALTYPTQNLRALVTDVIGRLAGNNDKAIHQLSLTYGGGKTHALIVLAQLTRNPVSLPDCASVREFRAAAGVDIPKSRTAALCFDKIDAVNGLETRAPDDTIRRLRMPWSILAWQIAGDKGLEALNLDAPGVERDTPPAEDTLRDLLSPARRNGLPLLILLDEVLMYARTMIAKDPRWKDYLMNFFQALTQAVSKADRCCLVASLLSSRSEDNDAAGIAMENSLTTIFGRLQQGATVTVTRDDVAEILRRRFFTPESISDPKRFRVNVQRAVANIADLDDGVHQKMSETEELYLRNYPFHPGIINVFYSKWNTLPSFQRTRGMLRTFALALRDAAWDDSPLVGPAVFLASATKGALCPATSDLVNIADTSMGGEKRGAWGSILQSELEKAREAEENCGLKQRETEQAVIATFLHSQPIGKDVDTAELIRLVAMSRPDKISLEKSLRAWADKSFWLDERLTSADGVPTKWKLGYEPNLTQMHTEARSGLIPERVEERTVDEVTKEKKSWLVYGVDAGVRTHFFPAAPGDIDDNGDFHYAVLGPDFACSESSPVPMADRMLNKAGQAENPRKFRNAVILLAPAQDLLEIVKGRVSDVMAWEIVRKDLEQSKQGGDGQDDLLRERSASLEKLLSHAKNQLSEAIHGAWNIALTLDDNGKTVAFKLSVGNDRPYEAIKKDPRSRLKAQSINPETLLPGGAYNLWSEDDTYRLVGDLKNSFAKMPSMPKMISLQPIVGTLAAGCADRRFVLELPAASGRPARTWWGTEPDPDTMSNPSLKLWLPEYAKLESIAPDMLQPGVLPELWKDDALSCADAVAYFAGGKTVTVQYEGYEEEIPVPKAFRIVVLDALAAAVTSGQLWLIDGDTSMCGEQISSNEINESAVFRVPPEPVSWLEFSKDNLADAWTGDTITARTLYTCVCKAKNIRLPWKSVQEGISSAINMQSLEVVEGSVWPCPPGQAEMAVFRRPAGIITPPSRPPLKFTLTLEQLEDLSELSGDVQKWISSNGGNVDVRFNVHVTAVRSGSEEEIAGAAMDDLAAIFDPFKE